MLRNTLHITHGFAHFPYWRHIILNVRLLHFAATYHINTHAIIVIAAGRPYGHAKNTYIRHALVSQPSRHEESLFVMSINAGCFPPLLIFHAYGFTEAKVNTPFGRYFNIVVAISAIPLHSIYQ